MVQLVAASVYLFVALILREILLGVTRIVFRLPELPAIWLGPKGSVSYGWSGAVYSVWAALVTITFGCLAYWSYVRLFERRVPIELEREGAAKELGSGLFIGVALVGIVAVLFGCSAPTRCPKDTSDGSQWLLRPPPPRRRSWKS